MKKVFLLFATIAIAHLLAACGGGDTTTSSTPNANSPPAVFEQPAWASPAMLVPPGQSSVSIALTGCNLSNRDAMTSLESLQRPIIRGTSLYTASLVITSAGSISLIAATSTTATLSTVTQWLSEDTAFANLSVMVSGGTVTSLELLAFDQDEDMGFILTNSATNHSLLIRSMTSMVSCNGAGSVFELKNLPSDTRINARFVPVGQTTTLSWGVRDSSTDGIDADDSQAAIHLNQASGSFSISTSGTSTITPFSLLVNAYIADTNAQFSYEESTSPRGIGLKVLANIPETSIDDVSIEICSARSVISPQGCDPVILD